MKPRPPRRKSKDGKRVSAPPCHHLKLALERTAHGYLTGFYLCQVCGAQLIVNALDNPARAQKSESA